MNIEELVEGQRITARSSNESERSELSGHTLEVRVVPVAGIYGDSLDRW
jgi:hypothetical protein